MERAQLVEAAFRLGVELSDGHALTILRHLEIVLRDAGRFGVTSVTDRATALRLHVLDSLSAALSLDSAPEGALVDIGSGAGYPGIPLAVVSGRRTTLLESRTKKAGFLRRATKELGIDHEVTVATLRAEVLARRRPEAFGAAVARAVAPLAALAELAAPLLVQGGVLLAMKGVPSDEERAAGRAAAARAGLLEDDDVLVELPGGNEARVIVRYRKAGPPELDLPRRDGLAQKRPLA